MAENVGPDTDYHCRTSGLSRQRLRLSFQVPTPAEAGAQPTGWQCISPSQGSCPVAAGPRLSPGWSSSVFLVHRVVTVHEQCVTAAFAAALPSAHPGGSRGPANRLAMHLAIAGLLPRGCWAPAFAGVGFKRVPRTSGRDSALAIDPTICHAVGFPRLTARRRSGGSSGRFANPRWQSPSTPRVEGARGGQRVGFSPWRGPRYSVHCVQRLTAS
jgi:hypothetical protein